MFAAIGVGTLVLPAAPASASVLTGVTIVSAVSTADSVAQKSARVSCPAGLKVVGAGASIGYVANQVHITGVVPWDNEVTAYASEDDTGYSYNWYVQVTAVCANPPSGYEIVSDYHARTSDPDASVSVNCPDGKVMLGAAADVYVNNTWDQHQNIPDVVTNQLLHSSVSEGMLAFAYEDGDGTSSTWILKGYAICADPVPGLQVVYSWGGMTNTDNRYEMLTCPAGKRVLSVGGHIYFGTGEVSFTTMKPGRYNSTDYVMLEAAEDEDGMSAYYGSWRMDAWATCAPSWVMTPL
jgi:hypothetical protein